MKKRILSTLLCLVLLVGLFPTSAFAIWGIDNYYECIFCGAVYWGEDVDDSIYEESDYCCGIDGNQDCWLENHCYECGEYVDRSVKHDCCNWCDDCIADQGTHCSECDECYLSEEDQLCGECHRCDTCAAGICEDCGLCDDCAEDGDNTHCIFCGACASSADWHDDTHHCLDCCVWCDQCGDPETCTADDPSVEYCDECGLCMTCCMENRDAAGCEAYCVESEEFEYHFCEECGDCFCDKNPCEYCGLCEECCEANSVCTEHMCVEDSDYEDHICPDCGECSHKSGDDELCEYCGLCETCCKDALKDELDKLGSSTCSICESFECVEADGFADHMQTHDPNYVPPVHNHFWLSAWCMDETHHWHECASKSCTEKDSYYTHNYISTGGDICSLCGYKSGAKVYFIMAPKDAHVQVSAAYAELSDPAHYWNNRTTFRVKAFGKGLTYQWYQVKNGVEKQLVDNPADGGTENKSDLYVSGATTPTLTVSVHWEGCTADCSYYCVVTDSEGNTAESYHAKLVASHRYSVAKADENAVGGKTIYVKTSTGYKDVFVPVSTGHRWYCCGDGHNTATYTRDKVAQSHDFGTESTIKAAYTLDAAEDGNFTEFKKFECKDCGYTKYVENHECKMEAKTYDAGHKDIATKHKLVCKTAGCEKTSSAPHRWAYVTGADDAEHSGYFPGENPNDPNNGKVNRRCIECGYLDTSFTSWTAVDTDGNKSDLTWNKTNILIEVENGTANHSLAEPGDTIVLTPKLDGTKKFTGWKVNYNYFDAKSGEEKNKLIFDPSSGSSSVFAVSSTDGTWSYTIPSDFFTTYSVPGGGMLTFEGKYGEACTEAEHGEGCKTILTGYKKQVCIYDGYTGDEVCADCGALVKKGSVIKGGDKHEATLTLVPGTAVEASCTKRGYEGDYECSVCGHTVSGERTGYAHNNKRTVNYKAATCYEKGYTGDTVCADCGKPLANGKETPKLEHIWDEGEPGEVKRGPITYTAMIYHCTRPGCTGTKTGLLRNAPKSDDLSTLTKLDFTMTGYEMGNTVGDVNVTMPSDVSGSTYRIYRTIPLKKTDGGMVFVPPTISSSGQIRNDGKAPLGNGYAFKEEQNYYLVVTVNPNDEMSLHSKAVATLNSKQSALYFGEVKIPATSVTINGNTLSTPAKTVKMAVFKLTPFQSTSHDVTVKYSAADSTGAGNYKVGSTVVIDAGTKDGYTFSGWTGDKTGSSPVTSFTMPDHDVTLIANWTKNGSAPVVPDYGDYDDSEPSYTVTVKDTQNGEVSANRRTAEEGETVTVTVDPAKGYTLETLTVVDKDGKELKLTSKGNGKYTFTMPDSKVTVTATFMDDNTMLNFFVDVTADKYYYDAVLWAAENGITGGIDATHFAPYATCTRAQAVTFLWRAAGCPAPKSSEMPFTDVPSGSYCYDAVLWAVENGITKGTTETTFSPNAECSRAQIVTFLWRSQKSPAIDAANPFTDVSAEAYYASAVLWAAANGITGGTTATTFTPNANCTRAQIVTFIYRCMK